MLADSGDRDGDRLTIEQGAKGKRLSKEAELFQLLVRVLSDLHRKECATCNEDQQRNHLGH